MDLGTKILKYARYILEECSEPVSEIEFLVSELLDTDKREEIKETIEMIIEQNNL